jgi:hypothetical protein
VQPLNLKCDFLVSSFCFHVQLCTAYAAGEANKPVEQQGVALMHLGGDTLRQGWIPCPFPHVILQWSKNTFNR